MAMAPSTWFSPSVIFGVAKRKLRALAAATSLPLVHEFPPNNYLFETIHSRNAMFRARVIKRSCRLLLGWTPRHHAASVTDDRKDSIQSSCRSSRGRGQRIS